MNDIDVKNALDELIIGMRNRPEIYIGTKSLRLLRTYIDGFLYAISLTNSKSKYIGFYPGFQEWIAEKYEITSSHSWNSIIAFYSIDEAKAFDLFYELLDEFFLQKQ